VYEATYDFNGTQYFTYSEINGIFWTGAAGTSGEWEGGNNGGEPTTNAADIDKVMLIDAQGTDNNPTLTEDAIVECVWIKEGSKLMVESDNYLEFDEDFVLDGEIRLLGDAQLIQTHEGATNVQGNGTIYKDQTATVANVYRYHYWSSPVKELNASSYRLNKVLFDGTIPTSENSLAKSITWTSDWDGDYTTDPITISRYWAYSYLDGDSDNDWFQKFETGTIESGQGFIMKSTARPGGQGFTFVGTPNDGSISFNLSPGKSSLLGNPYPSSLDGQKFINLNLEAMDGTLYFWEHKSENASTNGSEGHNFRGYQGGYSQLNADMGIAANQAENASLIFNWEDATVTTGEVRQTSDNFTATVVSDNDHLILEGANNKIVKNESINPIEQTITINFSPSIDIASVFLLNDTDGDGSIDLTISSGTSNSKEIEDLSRSGKTIELGWKGISSLTIKGKEGNTTAYKLGIGKIKFEDPNRPSLGDFTYTEPERYVAVGQGFFVTGSLSGGSVRFENNQRMYTDEAFFFKGESKKRAPQDPLDLTPIIKLGFNYVDSFQKDLHRQIGISFKRGNTFKYDNGSDSEVFDIQPTDFYWSFPDYSNKNLIIAGVGQITNTLDVPITFVISNNNPISIELDEIKNIDQEVFIEDKVTGNYYTLNENTLIELNLEEGVYKDRFFLTFNQRALNVEDSTILDTELSIFMDNEANELVINNNNTVIISKVAVFNLLGQQVKSWKNIENTTENRLKINKLSSTIYIVKVLTPKGSISKKIIIE
jgi:hypothetical protein